MNRENLLVAHGGGPTAVINASLAGVISEAQKSPAVGRILAARHGVEGVLSNDLLELTDISESDLARLTKTPASAIGSCRYKVTDSDLGKIAETLRSNNVRYFLYNGGNDSMDTCLKLSRLEADVSVAGIPKTIDNDLARTDHSPGFGSAARYYAVSTAELCLEVRALNIHVCVLEVMGRNAGWLCASTALAADTGVDRPRFLLLPEQPFDEERFLAAVEQEWGRSPGFVVAVSEGLTDGEGRPIGAMGGAESVDAFGHRLPGGAGEYIASLIRSRLKIRARSEKPGLLGRASAQLVSTVDREEAWRVGRDAVRELVKGNSGFMIALERATSDPYSVRTAPVPLSEVANVERKLPQEYVDQGGLGISPAFVSYCRPLLGKPLPSDYFLLR